MALTIRAANRQFWRNKVKLGVMLVLAVVVVLFSSEDFKRVSFEEGTPAKGDSNLKGVLGLFGLDLLPKDCYLQIVFGFCGQLGLLLLLFFLLKFCSVNK